MTAASVVMTTLTGACVGIRTTVPKVEACVPYNLVTTGTVQGVVFPAQAGWVEGRKPDEVAGYWTPSREDVARAEARVGQCFERAGVGGEIDLSSYRRQYVGFRLEGRKLLFVNLVASVAGHPDWRCRPVVVDDAGETLLHFEFDLDADRCQRVFNGWGYGQDAV